jgi:hypothetical protein
MKFKKVLREVFEIYIAGTSMLGMVIMIFFIGGQTTTGENALIFTINQSINKNGLIVFIALNALIIFVANVYSKLIFNKL